MRWLSQMKEYVEDKALGAWVWLKTEQGQGLIEYALILVLIVILVIVLLTVIGQKVQNVYINVNAGIP